MKQATVLALAMVLAAGLASGSSLETRFAAPAQASGDVELEADDWALLIFHQPSAAALRLEAESSLQTNSTYIVEKTWDPANTQAPVPLSRQTSRIGSVHAGLTPEGQWSSLLVRAQSISFRSSTVHAGIDVASEGAWLSSLLPPRKIPYATTDPVYDETHHVQDEGVAMAFQPREGAGFQAWLRAQGVRHLEWHNADVTCAASCPDSSKSWTQWDPTGTLRVQRLSYVRLEPSTALVEGELDLYAAAVGGSLLQVNVDGTVRLPEAYLVGPCGDAACPDPAGRTLRGEGEVGLHNVSSHDGRMRADLSAAFSDVAYDEAPQDAFSPSPQAAVAANLAILVLAWLVKQLVALFVRSDRQPALKSLNRRRLYELIQDQPGLSRRQLQRRLEWPDGTARHHLARLVEDGLVITKPYRNAMRHFENHGRYTKNWLQILLLSRDDERRLWDHICRHPGAMQRDLIETTTRWGWTRGATLHRINHLVEAGLLSVFHRGRRASYHARGHEHARVASDEA